MDIFILGAILLIGFIVYILSPVLLPFVLGIIFAYLLAPITAKLSKKIKNRTLATLIPLSLLMGSVFTVLVVGIPFIAEDISIFIQKIPTYAAWLEKSAVPGGALHSLAADFGIDLNKDTIREYIYTYSDQIALAALDTLQQAALSAMAIFDVLSLLIITPLVTFYLVYDWPNFTKKIQKLLPTDIRKNVMSIVKKIDKALNSFLRGQISVSITLGLFYGICLSAYGLQMGFFVGMLTGLLSFIPFIGMAIGLVFASVLAIMQYQITSVEPYIIIASIFAVGQLLESFLLTPKFIGKSVGLHPVFVIFSVMAGGELGGFLGMLIALPLATISTVIIPIMFKAWIKERIKHKKKA